MSALFEIGAALLSRIFGLAANDESVGTPLDDSPNDATTVLTLEQPPQLHTQPDNVQDTTTHNQNSTTDQGSSITQASLNSLQMPSHDLLPDLEAGSPSSIAVVGNDVPERQRPPKTSRLSCSRLLTAGAVLILGVLPLIVLPGVIMGALTGQILMGIALSSAVATVVGVFAGCYYYIKREG